MNTSLWNMDSGLTAPLGARVRAPVGWRIFDAPGRPGMTNRVADRDYPELASAEGAQEGRDRIAGRGGQVVRILGALNIEQPAQMDLAPHKRAELLGG
jgi:hypothetical protein